MAELGVLSEADRMPGEMPYPVQKRVALARALVSDPKVLLLDEPAGGIGAADMHELGRLIRSWVSLRRGTMSEAAPAKQRSTKVATSSWLMVI